MAAELSYILMERRHLEWARRLHNDDSTLLQLNDVSHVSEAQQDAWFDTVSRSASSRRYVVLRDSIPIGVFRIDALDQRNRSVMVGLDIAEEARGQGLAVPIYQHFMAWHFDQLGLNRVWLKVLETNRRAIHIYQKLGFKVEGRERQAIFRDGCFRDLIIMSVLRTEWDGRDA